MTTIDATGLSCPQPAFTVQKILEKMEAGKITVLVDTEASRENVTRCANSLGWKKTSESPKNGIWDMEFSKE